jgi:hypothetical protein
MFKKPSSFFQSLNFLRYGKKSSLRFKNHNQIKTTHPEQNNNPSKLINGEC